MIWSKHALLLYSYLFSSVFDCFPISVFELGSIFEYSNMIGDIATVRTVSICFLSICPFSLYLSIPTGVAGLRIIKYFYLN